MSHCGAKCDKELGGKNVSWNAGDGLGLFQMSTAAEDLHLFAVRLQAKLWHREVVVPDVYLHRIQLGFGVGSSRP